MTKQGIYEKEEQKTPRFAQTISVDVFTNKCGENCVKIPYPFPMAAELFPVPSPPGTENFPAPEQAARPAAAALKNALKNGGKNKKAEKTGAPPQWPRAFLFLVFFLLMVAMYIF